MPPVGWSLASAAALALALLGAAANAQSGEDDYCYCTNVQATQSDNTRIPTPQIYLTKDPKNCAAFCSTVEDCNSFYFFNDNPDSPCSLAYLVNPTDAFAGDRFSIGFAGTCASQPFSLDGLGCSDLTNRLLPTTVARRRAIERNRRSVTDSGHCDMC